MVDPLYDKELEGMKEELKKLSRIRLAAEKGLQEQAHTTVENLYATTQYFRGR